MNFIVEDEAIVQIQKLHSSAISLKEKYDKGDDQQVIQECTKTYLVNYDHLTSLIPKEILESSSVGKSIVWLRSKPGKNYSDVSNICSFGTFLLATEYLNYKLKKYKDEIQSLLK